MKGHNSELSFFQTVPVFGWLESLTSNPATAVALVRSPGDALLVRGGDMESNTGFQERWLGHYLLKLLKYC